MEEVQKILELSKSDRFQNLIASNINLVEVSKNQINVKSDIGKIKRRNPDLKAEEQISVTQRKCNLREKIIDFFKDYFLLSGAKYKAKYENGLKILIPKRMLQGLPIALEQVKKSGKAVKLTE